MSSLPAGRLVDRERWASTEAMLARRETRSEANPVSGYPKYAEQRSAVLWASRSG